MVLLRITQTGGHAHGFTKNYLKWSESLIITKLPSETLKARNTLEKG